MLLYLILYVTALVLAGVAAFAVRRGPTMMIALGLACVAFVGALSSIQHV